MADISLCSIEGCGKPAKARDMCGMHYQRWRKTAADDEVAGYVQGPRVCSVEGCGKSARRNDGGVRGWCKAHYARWVRNGSPTEGRTPVGAPLAWIEAHTSYEGDDCIRWPFAMTADGPSTIVFRGRKTTAGRVMCTLAHGDPPTASHEAAHGCGNGHLGCMNRKHLRWATCSENHQDAVRHGTHEGLRHLGSAHPLAVLNEEAARKIKGLIAHGLTNAEIGRRFGVSSSTIWAIRAGKTWRHV